MNPKYPVYVVSRGRWKIRKTISALERMKVPHKVVIDSDEYEEYAKVVDRKKLLTVPLSYYAEYDTCDSLGLTKRAGPGPARNFCWDDAVNNGFSWHWVMDDNINHFCRANHGERYHCIDGTLFKCMEDFCDRYTNIAMAGPAYRGFYRSYTLPPFTTNTRIYSCNLIRNNISFRWRGRYNEDTILSLDMLKAGWCTLQFYVFLQDKATTQTINGGNTAQFYRKEGTLPKSLMQVSVHSDCSKLIRRFGRWHHYVDYKRFKQKPILKENVQIKKETDNYGMKLVATSSTVR